MSIIENKYPETTDGNNRRNLGWIDLNVGRPIELENQHGCPLGCIYCNQQSLDRDPYGEKEAGYLFQGVDSAISLNTRLMSGSKVIKEIKIDDVVEEIKTYPHFNPNSPVLIENFNDPGLDWSGAIDTAERLRKEVGHEGPSIFITKMPMSDRNAEKMRDFKDQGGKPIVVVTYSGLPTNVEPASGKRRIETLKKLSDQNVPTILSIRPLIEGINLTDENLRKVAREAGMYADKITVGGLFVYQPETIDNFKKAGYELGERYSKHTYTPAKVLPPGTKIRVREIMKEEGISANVHDHTSCAVAEICTTIYGDPTTDRLAHWAGGVKPDFEYCMTKCGADQIKVCRAASELDQSVIIEKAEKELHKLGYKNRVVTSATQAGLLLVKDGSLTIGELFTLAEQTGWQANNWPDREALMYRTEQAVTEDLGLPKEVVLGAIPVGQEWYVVMNGNVDGNNNELAVKWIRSRNRARIQVINVDDLNGDGFGKCVEKLVSASLNMQSRDEIELTLKEILCKKNGN